jgi:uncharacterized phage infection (PIP) family protein YhgE
MKNEFNIEAKAMSQEEIDEFLTQLTKGQGLAAEAGDLERHVHGQFVEASAKMNQVNTGITRARQQAASLQQQIAELEASAQVTAGEMGALSKVLISAEDSRRLAAAKKTPALEAVAEGEATVEPAAPGNGTKPKPEAPGVTVEDKKGGGKDATAKG